jgi:DNA-binding Xre family transcriptional regulator
MKKKQSFKTKMTVDQACVKKGIHNPYQLHQKSGLSIPRANKLWKGKGKFELNDIDILCDTLLCKVKDIFKRVPVEAETDQ